MKPKNLSAFIPGLNAKNMTNTASESAIEKKLNTEKVSTASPAVPEARTALEESAASEISTTFHPEKVSIIMPAFNAKDTIGEAIESALNGTHQNLEILVIDDGSTDGTENTVTEMAQKDQRIKYYKNPTNLGAYQSRNLMIEAATGQFIAFLDSDDTWEPNKLEECLKMLKQHPEIKSVGHALRYLDKRGNKVGYIPTYPTNQEELQEVQENGELPWVFPTALVLKREALLGIGGFVDWKVGADTEFIARLAQKHGMLATKMPLGNY